jgi:sortase A
MSLNPHLPGYRRAELLCYGAGALLTALFVVQLARGEAQRQGGISRFDREAQRVAAGQASQATADLPPWNIEEPDTTLWAPGRIAEYEASREMALPPVLGVLAIPSVALEVPVYASSSHLSLNRGAGTIDGMAYPHEPGNIGISGHRDGYFRALKDVRVGDTVLLRTLAGPRQFHVDGTRVVGKTDTSVLQETDEQRLTLVTCYPFYYVGHAPQRFIVTASPDTNDVNHN